MRYSRIPQIHLDTARDTYGYSWIQWDTAGYSGSAAEWLDTGTGIQRDTKEQGYVEIQAGYR